MTGTEKIKAKILEDASLKAKEIVEQAIREAREITDAAKEDAGKKRAGILEKAESDGTESYRRLLAVAGLEGRKDLLKAKQDMLEKAFNTALEKVAGLPDKEYQSLLEQMIGEAAVKGEGEILLTARDLDRVDSKMTDNINKKLKSAGKKGNLKLSQDTIHAAGGFVLRQGEMEINSTFEILFGMLRPDLENDIVEILFGA